MMSILSYSSSDLTCQENSLQFLQQKADDLLAAATKAIEEGDMGSFNQVFETKSEIDFLDSFYEGNTCDSR
jgi:hypothetical protein